MLILPSLNSAVLSSAANNLILNVTPADFTDVVGGLSARFGTLQPGEISQSDPSLGTELKGIWGPIQDYFNTGSGAIHRRDLTSTTWHITPTDFQEFVNGYDSFGFSPYTFPNPGNEEVLFTCPECGLTADITVGGAVAVSYFLRNHTIYS